MASVSPSTTPRGARGVDATQLSPGTIRGRPVFAWDDPRATCLVWDDPRATRLASDDPRRRDPGRGVDATRDAASMRPGSPRTICVRRDPGRGVDATRLASDDPVAPAVSIAPRTIRAAAAASPRPHLDVSRSAATQVPKGPMIGRLLKAQKEWQLENPSGEKGACLEHLRGRVPELQSQKGGNPGGRRKRKA